MDGAGYRGPTGPLVGGGPKKEIGSIEHINRASLFLRRMAFCAIFEMHIFNGETISNRIKHANFSQAQLTLPPI